MEVLKSSKTWEEFQGLQNGTYKCDLEETGYIIHTIEMYERLAGIKDRIKEGYWEQKKRIATLPINREQIDEVDKRFEERFDEQYARLDPVEFNRLNKAKKIGDFAIRPYKNLIAETARA